MRVTCFICRQSVEERYAVIWHNNRQLTYVCLVCALTHGILPSYPTGN